MVKTPLYGPGDGRRNIKHGKEEKTERGCGKNTPLGVVGVSPHIHGRIFPLTLAKLGTNIE